MTKKTQKTRNLLEALPYPESALSPYISARTMEVHYGKHHRAYAENTLKLIAGTDFENLPLAEIILKSSRMPEKKSLFNNAAQTWNHTFYWKSMKPKGGDNPGQGLLKLINGSFDNFKDFKEQFSSVAASHFGSGWVWLVLDKGRLKIIDTQDADNPLVHDQKPVLGFDVWEHAYYLDYQNQRAGYTKAFLEHLVNWGFAESNL